MKSIRWIALLLCGCCTAGFAGDAPKESQYLRNIRQITFAGSKSGEAYFSADGKSIVFQSVREPGNPFYQIYKMDLADGAATRVSTGKGRTTCAYFHPTKKRILFASSHLDPETDAKQKAEIEKLKAGPPPRYQWDFDKFLDIFEADYDGGNLVQLTNAEGYDAECAYSPDGSKIVFCSFRDKDGDGEIYIMDADGKNQTRLTNEKGYDGGPFFSPDGKKIVWRHIDNDSKIGEVWTMDIDGSKKKQVTQLKSLSWAPFWHPSMKWIVFSSNVDEPSFELYAIRPDGTELTRLTYTDGFDGLPAISPDGLTLMWTSNRAENRSQIFLAELCLPGDVPPLDVGIEKSILGAAFSEHLQGLVDAAAVNNYDHQIGHLLMSAGLKPFGKFDEVEETSFVQGPSIVGWRPPVNKDDTVVVLAAPVENNAGSPFEISALVEAAARLGQKTDAPRSGVYAAAAYTDELPNVLAGAVKALKDENKDAAPIHASAFVSFVGLSRVHDRRVVLRGAGTAAGIRELAERLAARHPEVYLSLEDDPGDAPGLVQKPPAEIPSIAIGGPKEEPNGVGYEPGDPAEERECRERAVALALDCVQLLADHTARVTYQPYDAAAAKAAANAAARPYLGTIPEYKSEGAAGVKLTGVREGSPAQKAGLKAGDIVIELNGKPVKNVDEYLKALEGLKVDVATTIKVQREGKEEKINVTPTARR